ncbi:MAG: hypothetical protein EBX92_03590 [Actinobacteria bacterium]|nr:hypothetical protein [Actinomycetota bacterium]
MKITLTNKGFGKRKKLASIVSTSILASLFMIPSSGAQATDGVWTYPVPESVMQELEVARVRAHQNLMDLPVWNTTIFGPFPAAAITTQAGNVSFVHINLPTAYGNKSASVRMGMLKDTTWVNTTLGFVKLNKYGNGTYKTSVQMPTGTRAQIYVGGKLITTTIRP